MGLLSVTLLGASLLSSPAASAEGRTDRQLISEGLGIEGIFVGRSTMENIVAAYGKDYNLIKHGTYSVEIQYRELGLSFYYCVEDQQKRIFDIECYAPFDGFTARGIILGRSTLSDVAKAYGSAELLTTSANESWFYKYPGIIFHVKYKDGDQIPKTQMLDRKIIAINIVTRRSGVDCGVEGIKTIRPPQ